MLAVPWVTLKRLSYFFFSPFFAALLCGHKWRIIWKKNLFVSQRRGSQTKPFSYYFLSGTDIRSKIDIYRGKQGKEDE